MFYYYLDKKNKYAELTLWKLSIHSAMNTFLITQTKLWVCFCFLINLGLRNNSAETWKENNINYIPYLQHWVMLTIPYLCCKNLSHNKELLHGLLSVSLYLRTRWQVYSYGGFWMILNYDVACSHDQCLIHTWKFMLTSYQNYQGP